MQLNFACAFLGATLHAPLVHPGPISVVEVYNMRLWSSGGTAKQCSVIEWDIYGSCQGQYDITEYGAAPMPPA